MWVTKKKWNELQERIAALEKRTQEQLLEKVVISLADSVDSAVDLIFHIPEKRQP